MTGFTVLCKEHTLGDNCIQNIHLGRYIIGLYEIINKRDIE